MWPFRKKNNEVGPPVDLNIPVTNPRLVAAIDSFLAIQGAEQLNTLLLELRRADYLVIAFMGEAGIEQQTGTNQVTIPKGTTIGILELEDPQGERILPLFSDWDAIRKHTNEQASTLVMPAKQAWTFAAEKYGGAVVNPGGPSLPLNRDQVNDLAQTSLR